MTQQQIARLMELQKLYEEGILNKDDLASEKAKILGTNKPTEKTAPEKQEDTTPSVNPVNTSEPAETSVLKVTLSKKVQTATTKPESANKELEVIQTPKTEQVNLINTPQPEHSATAKEPITTQETSTNSEQPTNSKTTFQKFKIPILIVAGLLVLLVAFSVAKRFKYSSDFYSGYATENNNNGNDGSGYGIYEDKFEKLWEIGSTRDYTEEDLRGWNKDDLNILRNYFFARNNFYFGSKQLRDHFSKYAWYQPVHKEVGDWFSDLQINNVQYIKKLEGLSNYYQPK